MNDYWRKDEQRGNDSHDQYYKKKKRICNEESDILSHFNSHLQLNVIVRSYTGANVTEYVFQFINDVFASHNAEYRDQRITNDVEEFRKTKMITHCLDMMKKNHESLLAITQ